MRLSLYTAALLAAAVCASPGLADDQPAASPPGLGDPGQLVKIEIVTGRAADGKFVIAGRDADVPPPLRAFVVVHVGIQELLGPF